MHRSTRNLAALLLAMACANLHAGPVTRTQSFGVLAVPSSANYGSSFNDLATGIAGIQIAPAGVPITLSAGDDFHDQYSFSIGAALANISTLTIDLGAIFNIDGLTARLYDGAGASLGTLGQAWTLGAVAPVAISSAGVGPFSGELQLISSVALPAGSYLLDVSGFVTGSFGGSYGGVINLSSPLPVPEPASSALLLLGLAAVAVASRARRSLR